MSAKKKPKGPWINRFVSRILTLLLGLLIYWLLGFMVEDIKDIRGPDYQSIEVKHVDQSLMQRIQELSKQIKKLGRQIESQRDEQRLVGDGSQNLQKTVNQLLELKRLSIEKEIDLPAAEHNNLTTSLSAFLENQKSYQVMNQRMVELSAGRRSLEEELSSVQATVDEQRKPAREEYNRLNEKHRLRLAGYQLAILVPLLVIGGFLVTKRRSSIYFPLYCAFGGAALLKVAMVIHQYFPQRYLKYVLIGVLLLVVARVLIHFIRLAAYPKSEWLLRQYREAYERFLCPVCEYPIRTGPRKFLYWTRRTVNKRALGVPGSDHVEETYTCPSCGTGLFSKCSSCEKVRHTLLPHCQHCGYEEEVKPEEPLPGGAG